MDKRSNDPYFNQNLDEELKKMLEPVCDVLPSPSKMQHWKDALKNQDLSSESGFELEKSSNNFFKSNPWAIGFFANLAFAMLILLVIPLGTIKEVGHALKLEFTHEQRQGLVEELSQYAWTQHARVIENGETELTLLIQSVDHKYIRDMAKLLGRGGWVSEAEQIPLYFELKQPVYKHFLPQRAGNKLSDEELLVFLKQEYPELNQTSKTLLSLNELDSEGIDFKSEYPVLAEEREMSAVSNQSKTLFHLDAKTVNLNK